jgi:nucleoside-diphosphate-sugar epimerase
MEGSGLKVLVAGANGFIGMNLTLCLLNRGHEVIMSFRDELTGENRSALAPYGGRVRLEKGDLLNRITLEKLEELDFDAAINGAIITSTGDNELDYFIPMCNINLMTNVNLMELAIKKRLKKYVYISSSGVYGSYSNPGESVYEDSQLDLFSTYCITKYASELLAARLQRLSGIRTVTARIAAPYGPFERVTDGRVAMSPVYKMVRMANSGQEALIFGRNVVRDWTYIEDTVQGIARLLEEPELRHDVYNVSASVDVSLGEIAEAVQKAAPGFRFRFTEDPEKANIAMYPDQQRGALSIGRLKADTGYRAEYTIEKGVAAYLAALKESAGGGYV